MNLPRRRFLHLAAGAAAMPAVLRIARARTYPTRPVRIIVPFAATARRRMATQRRARPAMAAFAKNWRRE